MSFKSELQSVVNRHQNNLNSAINEIKAAENSGNYTPNGIRAKVETINTEFKAGAEINQAQGLEIISRAEEYFNSKNQNNTVSNLRDPGYQAGLANVLNLIEKNALSEKDFIDIVAAYKDDEFSIKSIRMALVESKKSVFVAYLPETREDKLKVFEDLRKNVRKFIYPVTVDNNIAALMSVSWLPTALGKLDDNLQLTEGEQ